MPFKNTFQDINSGKFYIENEDGTMSELTTINLSDEDAVNADEVNTNADEINTDTVKEFQKSITDLTEVNYSIDGPIGEKTKTIFKKMINMALNTTNNYKKFHHKPMRRNRKYRCKVYHYYGIYKVEDKEYNVFIQVDRFNHCKIYRKDKHVNSKLTERY